MIKADMPKGTVELEGIESVLLTELTMILRSLKDNGVGFDLIEEAYRLAFMSNEELRKETKEKLKKMIERLEKNTDENKED